MKGADYDTHASRPTAAAPSNTVDARMAVQPARKGSATMPASVKVQHGIARGVVWRSMYRCLSTIIEHGVSSSQWIVIRPTCPTAQHGATAAGWRYRLQPAEASAAMVSPETGLFIKPLPT